MKGSSTDDNKNGALIVNAQQCRHSNYYSTKSHAPERQNPLDFLAI